MPEDSGFCSFFSRKYFFSLCFLEKMQMTMKPDKITHEEMQGFFRIVRDLSGGSVSINPNF